MNDDNVHDDLKNLATGINFAIASLNKGKALDFLLILVRPGESGDYVTLNTITGITEPRQIRQIGEHLVDMANAHGPEQPDPEDGDINVDVKGNA
jgi:hypothetical protein